MRVPAWARVGRPELLVLGDSHAAVFDWMGRRGWFPRHRVRAVVVPGATAQGMVNPNSKTNAIRRFKRAAWAARSDAVLLQLGEVDCGFVIWYRARKHQEPVESQMRRSLAGYFSLVDWLTARGHERIVLTGAALPTIRDGQTWGDVANARKEVTASQAERTALTLRYNAALRDGARARGLAYVEITDRVLDPTTGLVAPEFLGSDPLDHHLSTEKTAPLWADALRGIVETRRSAAMPTQVSG
jgi:hypothetical protein